MKDETEYFLQPLTNAEIEAWLAWNRYAEFNNKVRCSLRAIGYALKDILNYFRNHWRDLRHAPWRKM